MSDNLPTPPMPLFKEGYITLWRNGQWLSVAHEEVEELTANDNIDVSGTGPLANTGVPVDPPPVQVLSEGDLRPIGEIVDGVENRFELPTGT